MNEIGWVLSVVFVIGIGVILYGLFSPNPFNLFSSKKEDEEKEPKTDPNLN